MNSSDQPLVANQVSVPDFPDNFEEFIELFEREYQNIVDAVNSKGGGLYVPEESATFQKYFDSVDPQSTKNVYRKVVDFGALPNNATKRVQHNVELTSTARLTNLYGASTDPSSISFRPLAPGTELAADVTDIIVTTTSDLSNYRETTVVMEYTK